MVQVSGSFLMCEKCMNWELHTLLQRSVFININSIFTLTSVHKGNLAIHSHRTKRTKCSVNINKLDV